MSQPYVLFCTFAEAVVIQQECEMNSDIRILGGDQMSLSSNVIIYNSLLSSHFDENLQK